MIDAELAKGKFSFIYKGSKQTELKIKHCIPFLMSRTICESAVRSLRRAFDVDEFGTVGYNYAGGLKIVVKIPEDELQLVRHYFMHSGRNEEDASDLAFRQGIQWFGIVDGVHTHKSLSDLERFRPDPFQDFKWTVTVIKWQPISVLRAFSRARNLLQTTNAVDMTLYDTISGIYEIALQKANMAGEAFESFVRIRGVITAIADEFSGGTKYSRQTTRTLTGAVVRIKRDTLEVLRQIMTEENDELARKVMEKTSSCKVLPEDVFDARAYKSIISTNTIRSAKVFLDACTEDQSNALMRLKFSYEENGFKTFQASRLNKEVERCQRARRQDVIMKSLMGLAHWPDELAEVRKRLFQTSIFDFELDQCHEDTHSIIESLVNEYREKRPLEAGLRWTLYLRYLATLPQSRSNTAPHSGVQNEVGEEAGENDTAIHEEFGMNDENIDKNDISGNASDSEASCPLVRLYLKCYNMSLEKYLLYKQNDDEKFHLVLGDPSQLQLMVLARLY